MPGSLGFCRLQFDINTGRKYKTIIFSQLENTSPSSPDHLTFGWLKE